MTDLVTKLRAHRGSAYMCQDCYGTVMDEAADEIERLQRVTNQQPIEKAPIDEWCLLADSGGYVQQAIFGEDEENPRWRLASGGYLHPNFKPLWWMLMPANDCQGA